MQKFATIFLGIFISAAPFMLIGTLVSGFIEHFISKDQLKRFIPGKGIAAAASGVLLGLIFPVCECGVVPVTRRLIRKGVSISTAISFMLAAPVMNPVVIASTWAAFGFGRILLWRILLGGCIACLVGLIFNLSRPEEVMLGSEVELPQCALGEQPERDLTVLFNHTLMMAGYEFFEMGRYLVVGSLLAASMQAIIPQAAILAIGQGPISSVVVMLALAFALCVCSTVDAFVALGFAANFTTASILAFLVFGAMVDLKSTIMFLGVFKRRIVIYLIVLPLQLVFLLAVFANLNLGL